MPHAGELCALGAASCWTVSSYAFGWASRAAGSVAINQFRLWAAVLVLAALLAIRTGSPWPIG
ncbi:MAG: EamA family transporter, partial [Planctomycetes bacterium]|nr:EamA family transporter [Planctomycetota bacterium]